MKLSEIFLKPVSRSIEGVIKADDDQSLRTEIDEYVLTNEISSRLEEFLTAYGSRFEGANGAWISGFFGSGKSHLLKMLAMLLENRDLDGSNAFELFKEKCSDNAILEAALKKVARIPSESILFNIDQKSDVITRDERDALLSVFVKVFDEHCGYYGKQWYIAQFERDLDDQGKLSEFKSCFERESGKSWEKGREASLIYGKQIAKAYVDATGATEADAATVLQTYRNEYSVSIEDFAEKINAYLQKKPADHRLNFFVDEVGQFIADNAQLMLNLQTIAESLATRCKGRAWVVVTAQEDMENVIGEMTARQQNDFSRIQARFKQRLKLTSANVDEVIQKRLLSKTEAGIELLSEVHQAQSNNFGTLFTFTDGTTNYRSFRDLEHFVNSYPFIPYQYALFQQAIQQLSRHNAFEGRHSSVGERSMLGVFQEVAKQIENYEVGRLATFDLMFEGIRTALKAQIYSSIQLAQANLDDKFALQLLKALFLVKYVVNHFKPTVHNLCILMMDGFGVDISELRLRVEGALNLLESQTYIQRNGNLYEYLTDNEKDIEQEIKATEIDSADIADELQKIIFDSVIGLRRIRYNGSTDVDKGQDYAFSRKLDDRLYGTDRELSIHVISPFHEHATDEQMLRNASVYDPDQLLVILPPDDILMRDLMMYKRTAKYVRLNTRTDLENEKKRILEDKASHNRNRYLALQGRLQNLLSRSKMLVAGADVDVGGEDPQGRIGKGFRELLGRAYPNLRMLQGLEYTEQQIGAHLRPANDSGLSEMGEPATEIFSHIQTNSRGGVRTTLKALIEHFVKKPYGWSEAAVLCNFSTLYAHGKVEIRFDGTLLDDEARIEALLKNSHQRANMVIEPQVEFAASQVRKLREFCAEFLDLTPSSSEAKAVGKATLEGIAGLITTLSGLVAQKETYPFLSLLEPVKARLEEVAKKPYAWLLSELSSFEDEFLDAKEQFIDPIKVFMAGSQKTIYDSAKAYLSKQNENFVYLDSDLPKRARALLAAPDCYRGNVMTNLKILIEELQDALSKKIELEKSQVREEISVLQQKLVSSSEFSSLSADNRESLLKPFGQFSENLEGKVLIAVIREDARRFREGSYLSILEKLEELSSTKRPINPTVSNIDNGHSAGESKQTYVQSAQIKVEFKKPWIADEQDLQEYIKALESAYKDALRNGKRIQV